MPDDDMDLFNSMSLYQIDVPETYKAEHLWKDMVLYCNKYRKTLRVNI